MNESPDQPAPLFALPGGNPRSGEDPREWPDLIEHARERPGRLRRALPEWASRLSNLALTLVGIAALVTATALATAVGSAVAAALHWATDPAHLADPAAQLWHTVNDPLRHSLDNRARDLPARPATLHRLWAATGLLILWRSLRTAGSVGAQLGAIVFGALTAAAVWDGTPTPGKPVAAGAALLLWGALVALALTGSWITTHTTVINEITATPAAPVAPPVTVPVTVDVPEPRIEAVIVDVQQLRVDINGRRLTGNGNNPL